MNIVTAMLRFFVVISVICLPFAQASAQPLEIAANGALLTSEGPAPVTLASLEQLNITIRSPKAYGQELEAVLLLKSSVLAAPLLPLEPCKRKDSTTCTVSLTAPSVTRPSEVLFAVLKRLSPHRYQVVFRSEIAVRPQSGIASLHRLPMRPVCHI